jgi:hypothetical protein
MHLKNKESEEMHLKNKESEKMHLKNKESEEMPNGGVHWIYYARFHSNFVTITNFNEKNLKLNSK